MDILGLLKEQADLDGACALLSNELLTIRHNYEDNLLTREEYEYLLNEVAQVRAQDELATDEVAYRWIVAAAETLLTLA
jgi:hypothetical protein